MSSLNSSLNRGSFNNGMHKIQIDIPKFDGKNNQEGIIWIDTVDNYLTMHHIYDGNDKINIA